jgi:hypothetical protein
MLDVDDDEMQISFDVAIPDLADPRHITVQTASRLNLSGNSIGHDGSFGLTWNPDLCFTLSGQLSTFANEGTLSTTIDNLQRCPAECPTGSVTFSVTLEGEQATLQLDFDGDHSAKATITTPSSTHTIPVPILCG